MDLGCLIENVELIPARKDRNIREYGKHGLFSVKKMLNMLACIENEISDFDWRKLWKFNVPRKLQIFFGGR